MAGGLGAYAQGMRPKPLNGTKNGTTGNDGGMPGGRRNPIVLANGAGGLRTTRLMDPPGWRPNAGRFGAL